MPGDSQRTPRIRSEPTARSWSQFLEATGLPVVGRLEMVVRGTSAGLAIGCLLYAAVATAVWRTGGLWSKEVPLGGSLPCLVAAPVSAVAWWLMRRGRMHAAGITLFVALNLLSVLATLPNGAFSPLWYLQPILALLATAALGVTAGLSLTLLAVIGVMLGAWFVEAGSEPFLADIWLHIASLAAATLASALTGALLHKLLQAAVRICEIERAKVAARGKALRQRERLLRHSLRVHTVGDLAGMVTHQLRNAYQVMLGHLAMASVGDERERARRLQLIGDVLDRSRPMLDQLMGLAHPEEGKVVRDDLAALVEVHAQHVAMLLPAAIKLDFVRDADPVPVMINGRGLEHALWNLIINARHAMPEGGTVTIKVGRAESDRAVIEVADTGRGIPEDALPSIFSPYYTTKPKGQGTGLGLASVARFVRSCSGTIEVASELGVGTRFTMTFPLAPARSPADTVVA